MITFPERHIKDAYSLQELTTLQIIPDAAVNIIKFILYGQHSILITTDPDEQQWGARSLKPSTIEL